MKQISRITFLIYLLWMLFVIFLNLRGDITFGHGLGDLYYLIALIFLTVLSIVFYIRITKRNYTNAYLFVVYLLLIIISFCIKLTLLRGAEYPWNGKFFL